MKSFEKESLKAEKAKAIKLDQIDRKILNILQEDNQITNQDLAKKVGLSAPPCLRRVRELRRSGIITHDVSLIDPMAGQSLIVFVDIQLEKTREDLLKSFERKMNEQKEVLQCYFVSGDTDYIVVIHVSDVKKYHEFARKVFANEPNVRTYRSSFCLNRVKYSTKFPLPENSS